MELTVLGAQGTWPGAGGENCGYIVTQDGYHLQMDAGTGTFARLQQVVGVDDDSLAVVGIESHALTFRCLASSTPCST